MKDLKNLSLTGLIEELAKVEKEIEAEKLLLGEAKNEIDRQFLGTEKVKNVFGWEPKYSLDQGLKETIEWYKENLDKL